jgi:hypothetical protein
MSKITIGFESIFYFYFNFFFFSLPDYLVAFPQWVGERFHYPPSGLYFTSFEKEILIRIISTSQLIPIPFKHA